MFILLKKLKYYTKELLKFMSLICIAFLTIIVLIFLKFKPAYSVTISGEELGYINNKEDVENKLDEYINEKEGNVYFREMANMPEYTWKLVNRNKEYNDEKIVVALKSSVQTTYKMYAITVDSNVQTVVSTEQEAMDIITDMKKDIDESFIDTGIVEQYSDSFIVQSKEEANAIITNIKNEKIIAYNDEEDKKKKEARNSKKTIKSTGVIANIAIASPVEGMITSRFGNRSSIRSGAHTGLDIGASSGTDITPVAGGTVTFASYKGSYGNLVIINHGNGIESYYAHCSQILVSVGEEVSQENIIAKVGSTGNSTGAHLHLELRENGIPVDPEDYLYK